MCENHSTLFSPSEPKLPWTAEGLFPVLGNVFWKTCGSTVESPEETTKTDEESRKEVNKPLGIILAYVARD